MNYLTYKPLLLASLMSLTILTVSCTKEEHTTSMTTSQEETEQLSNRINIPVTVRKNLGITFAKVERRQVQNTFRIPGSFELLPLAKHEHRVMVSGHIEFLVDQLDEVDSGTPLYRFKSVKLLEMIQQIDLTKARLKQARDKFELSRKRQVGLKKAKFKNADLDANVAELKAEVSQKEAELLAIESLFKNIAKSLGIDPESNNVADWVEVRAKESGVVASLAVTNGAFVEESSLILTTINPKMVRFRAMALQSDVSRLTDGQRVHIVPPQTGRNDINDSIPADLKIGLSANPTQRTITLFAMPKGAKSWTRPGVSAFLEIAEESSDGVVLAIPRSSVVKDGLTHVFFKRDPLDPNKAIRVEADLGISDGRWVEIMSELGPNDEVVLNGVYELKLASEQGGKTQKGGHFHADGTFHDTDH